MAYQNFNDFFCRNEKAIPQIHMELQNAYEKLKQYGRTYISLFQKFTKKL